LEGGSPKQDLLRGSATRWLALIEGLQDMRKVDIEIEVKGRRPDPPVPAEPVTRWMIEQLEIFIADPATPLVAKHLAAAYLFCCYAVMRVEQARSCWIDAIRDNEFTEGYVFLDKNPKRDKMQPRPWWAPLYGITGSKLYFETLTTSLEGVKDECYIFRAYESQDGSVKNATGLLPGPLLQTNGLMKSLQEMFHMVCGFSVTESHATQSASFSTRGSCGKGRTRHM